MLRCPSCGKSVSAATRTNNGATAPGAAYFVCFRCGARFRDVSAASPVEASLGTGPRVHRFTFDTLAGTSKLGAIVRCALALALSLLAVAIFFLAGAGALVLATLASLIAFFRSKRLRRSVGGPGLSPR
jgi:DNA-directed RNA polymerase subunit RPC12/RpoP